ncbi:MAG: DJ-1/PfpI family protein [Prevotellaceae bacterium]|jgi:putative intracellular protease/amidase|nr:DJ-1/PfpI family protein [Prevotellaceae bacterium]
MTKKVAVLVVNPVNGMGLFSYLEAFFENGIPYKTFAVSDVAQVKTNSGIDMRTDDTVASLKWHENEYDALVLTCGDAMPKFSENLDKQFNQDLVAVMKNFGDKNKILAGHCVAALLFDKAGIGAGRKVALHPFAKPHLKGSIGTDKKSVVDGNLYTAQTENTISSLLPELLKALK